MFLGQNNQFDSKKRGIIMIIAGTVLLLHALGFLKIGLDIVIIIVALYMIVYGVMQSGLHQTVQQYLEKVRK
ncbi:MAG TPA: hypothetical protein VEK38_02915 [Candidatus Bathyarchaeia archaeon]|nr:hypothetical protein [Candidatus Bathyarchaeia archaeon]